MAKKLSASYQQEKQKHTKPGAITAKLAAELKLLEKMSDDEIDFSDIPLKLDWSNAEIGKFYRPIKELVSIRIDADILAWFKQLAKGKPYTPAMNKALRIFMRACEMNKS